MGSGLFSTRNRELWAVHEAKNYADQVIDGQSRSVLGALGSTELLLSDHKQIVSIESVEGVLSSFS